MLSHNFILHIDFGASNPKNSSLVQFMQMLKINYMPCQIHNLHNEKQQQVFLKNMLIKSQFMLFFNN